MSNVLTLPRRDTGRIRKRRSPGAMGRCSILLLERGGYNIPPNVTDVRTSRPKHSVDEGRLALRLSLAVFATLHEDQKAKIMDATKTLARHDDDWHGDESRALFRLLTGRDFIC